MSEAEQLEQLRLAEELDRVERHSRDLMYIPERISSDQLDTSGLPRTIALFHVHRGHAETVAIDFDAGSSGRVGRLNNLGLTVRNIPARDDEGKKRFVQSYLKQSLGEGLSKEVIDSAMKQEPFQASYRNPKEQGNIFTNLAPVLPLGKVATYRPVRERGQGNV